MPEQEGAKESPNGRIAPCKVNFVAGEKSFSGTSTHLSEKGMLVLCKNPAPLGTKGKVILKFPRTANPVELAGEVVWTNIYGAGDSLSPRGMGIKFSGVDKDAEGLLLAESEVYESVGSIYACYYT